MRRLVLLLLVFVLAGCGGGGGDATVSSTDAGPSITAPGETPAPGSPTPTPSPRVTTVALADAARGSAYAATLQATDGTPPYAWSLADGFLPPGLALDAAGTISGMPTSDGPWRFVARVTDAGGLTQDAEVSLTIGGAPHVLITEVMYDPSGSDTNREWLELYNPSAVPVDLSGWTVTDSAGTVKTDAVMRGQVLPANGTLVWAQSGFKAAYGFDPGLSGLSLSLGNSGESVTLRDRQGNVVDFVGFEIPDWTAVVGASTSIERASLADTDTAADWQAATAPGNPGAFAPAPVNVAPVADAGPDRVVNVGDTATLDGSGTADADGTPLFLRWGDGLRGATPSATFTAAGAVDLVLSACDGSAFGLDPVTIFVLDAGAPILGLARYNDPPRSHRIDADLAAVIDAATVSVDGAFFEVDRQSVVDALVRAKNRGLSVRIATEEDNYVNPANAPFYAQLEAVGIPVYRGATSGLTHDKFCVLDGQTVWTGSYNITDSDTVSNANDAIRIDSTSLALAYANEFAEFAGGRFGTNKTNAPVEEHVVQGRRVECHFAPDGVRGPILDAIASANVSIDFAIFTFTSAEIRDAIIGKARAGVQVRGVMDAAQAGAASSAFALLDAEPSILVGKDDFSGFLHHKLLVVDAGTASDPLVVTGSYNWTASAEDSNDENVLIIHDAGVALQYRHLVERRLPLP